MAALASRRGGSSFLPVLRGRVDPPFLAERGAARLHRPSAPRCVRLCGPGARSGGLSCAHPRAGGAERLPPPGPGVAADPVPLPARSAGALPALGIARPGDPDLDRGLPPGMRGIRRAAGTRRAVVRPGANAPPSPWMEGAGGGVAVGLLPALRAVWAVRTALARTRGTAADGARAPSLRPCPGLAGAGVDDARPGGGAHAVRGTGRHASPPFRGCRTVEVAPARGSGGGDRGRLLRARGAGADQGRAAAPRHPRRRADGGCRGGNAGWHCAGRAGRGRGARGGGGPHRTDRHRRRRALVARQRHLRPSDVP